MKWLASKHVYVLTLLAKSNDLMSQMQDHPSITQFGSPWYNIFQTEAGSRKSKQN